MQADNSPLLPELKLMQSCPLCSEPYDAQSVRVASQHEDATLLHVKCHKCSGALVAAVLQNGMGSSSVGMITDLSFEDVVHFKQQQAVSTDDCLVLHEFLKTDGASGHIHKKYESKTSRKTTVSKSKRSTR